MLLVPLQPVPNQALTIDLAGQTCQINVVQDDNGMFLDLLVNNSPIVTGVICENLNRIVRNLYLGFAGDLAFCDNEGNTDPFYTGLGPSAAARYSLLYIEASELPANEG